ncbi:hypothetical protein C8R45DRAFT_1067081 [Mycena sanguinolenta]|nr:hypothetical protein C8R45DRAFT_1067081 [Mycena sanguinolenta]
MDYESSDILGSDTLPVRNPGSTGWSGFSKTVFFLVLLLAGYIGAMRAWTALLKWREKSYRLFMRRQHGIPDNDHRPFNVAYAAVLRARREEEVANNRVHRVDVDELYAEADRRAAPVESDIRQRNPYRVSPPAWTNASITGLPNRFNPLAPDNRFAVQTSGLPPSSSHQTNFAERYNPNPTPAAPVVRFADEIEDASVPRRSNANNLNSSPRKQQKRALEEYEVELDVPENPKKMTRVEGDELIDGDEDAEWLPRQRRGEKRVLREEDVDAEDENTGSPGSRRVRGKRPRKINVQNPDVLMTSDDAGDDMDVDEEAERRGASIARGKKRNAGSTFDEEEADEEAQNTRRKRRTGGKRKSDAATPLSSSSRGQKRDRDVDGEGSEGEDAVPGTPKQSARKTKKRGKKSKEVREDDGEGSMDEGSVSKDKGKGRPIGDEWESNGVLYKIGLNGQRLRQALVKKAARRFTMPVDSQHPDKNANLEVCIETWLTEEEYKDLKSRHLLAWQDSPKGTQEPESTPAATPTAAEMPSTPTPNPVAKGKNLLWDSPASPFPVFAPSPAEKEQHRPQTNFRQSIATDLGMRVNPFDKTNALHVGADVAKSGLRNGRRVGAVRETGMPGLADSTNSIAAQMPLMRRTFSKWEKQDLEAKAMMKMREANQTKQKEKELKEKLEREKKEREAAAAKAALAPVPAISITAPSAEPAKPLAISFTPLAGAAAPANTAAKPPSLTPPTPAVSVTEPPKVSFAPSAPEAKPQPRSNMFAPSAPSAAAAAPSPLSNPFAKPPPAPASAPAPSSNPFAPTPAATNPPSSTMDKPSFSFSGAAAGTASAAAKTPFFAAPSAPADRPVAGRKPESAFPQQPPTSAPGPTANTGAPAFSFASQQNAAPQQPPSGGSLLSRLGGSAPASAPKPAETSAAPTFSFKPTGDQNKPASPFGAPQQQQAKPAEAPPAFSFKAPEQQNKPTSAFAPQAPPQAAQQQRQETSAQQQPSQLATPPPPKFNFAFAANPAAAAAASSTTSSLTGALGANSNSDSNKQPAPAFSFAKPAEKPATTAAPAFSFTGAKPAEKPSTGAPAFGFPAPTPTPAPAAGEADKKSGFGFNFGGAPSAFGATPSAFGGGSATPSTFGGGAASSTTVAPSAFGGEGAKSAFGGLGAKPEEEAPKAASAFGAGAPAASTSAPAFNFAFGGGNNNASTTPAGTPSPNPFAAKPSAFGGPSSFGKPAEGTSSTTPAGSPFSFGSKPAQTTPSAFGGSAPSIFGAKPEATASPSPSPFGAPAAPSVFGTGAGTGGPSAFGFGSSTTPATGFGQQK